MKRIVILFTIFILLITSFYIGANVGARKTKIHWQAVRSNDSYKRVKHEYRNFDKVAQYSEYLDNIFYIEIYDSIVDYGSYLNSWQYKIPVFIHADEATRKLLEDPIEFYLENKYEPRKVDIAVSVSEAVDESTAHGRISEEDIEKMKNNLTKWFTEEEQNFNRAVTSFKE